MAEKVYIIVEDIESLEESTTIPSEIIAVHKSKETAEEHINQIYHEQADGNEDALGFQFLADDHSTATIQTMDYNYCWRIETHTLND